MVLSNELIAKAVRENLFIGVNGNITIQQLLATKNISYKSAKEQLSFAELLDNRYTLLNQKIQQNPVSLLSTTVNTDLERAKLEMEVIVAFISEMQQKDIEAKNHKAQLQADAEELAKLRELNSAGKMEALAKLSAEDRAKRIAELEAKYNK